ncbi:peptidylprolyl isomerase [Flavihumibacter petaseus]|nr:peptidylprolyl isomerase [Flavihumibacter petaseus]
MFLLPVFLLIGGILSAQVLFTYGKHSVDKSEFLDAFRKNNSVQPPTEKAYSDYLELYVRYKLKIQAAYDLHLDTLPTQQKDIADFREQVINQYLSDDTTMDFLVKEALQHCRQDVRVAHIYLPFTGNDTLAAYQKALAALKALGSGKSFSSAAATYSADTATAKKGGDIGWISCFLLPYPLEKLAYNTPLNQHSALYKSKNAYHIFYPTATRPSPGSIQVAQILIETKPGAKAKEITKAEMKADSIYRLLQQGSDFGNLAENNSDDNSSYHNQGVMPAFSAGTYDATFEDQAFALQEDNAISKPFRTPQGFHILKRIAVFRYSHDASNEQTYAAMKTRVNNDPRIQLAVAAAMGKAKSRTGFKEVIQSDIPERYTEAFFQGDEKGKQLLAPDALLATIGKKQLFGRDYSSWLAVNADPVSQQQPPLTPAAIYQKFLNERLVQEYQQHLEDYNPAFAKQLKEFRDGNLIFEAMQWQVWDKAMNDEAGLQRYYTAHQAKYKWQESVRAVVFNVTDSATAIRVRNVLAADPSRVESVLKEYEMVVTADSGRFEFSQLPAYSAGMVLKPGYVSAAVFNRDNLNSSFFLVREVFPANQPRNFNDSRGLLLNDYQAELEEKWIAELKRQYPVKLEKAVWNSIVN